MSFSKFVPGKNVQQSYFGCVATYLILLDNVIKVYPISKRKILNKGILCNTASLCNISMIEYVAYCIFKKWKPFRY
jgi:hypothetical protein